MSNIKSPISFEILETGDGSPTLSLNGGEKMHSMEGALSESLYIYGECLNLALAQKAPISLLSMGLGLGYNELISLAILSESQREDFHIRSFESQEFLVEGIKAWAQDQPTDLSNCFNKVVDQISSHFKLPDGQLQIFAKEAMSSDRWQMHGALPSENTFNQKFNVILYDAFSSETDDYLWTETHLDKFFNQYCKIQCYFSTYAATGNLKRSLKNNGFLLKKKAGFGKKRESTLAIR